jgi:hypothetical protein
MGTAVSPPDIMAMMPKLTIVRDSKKPMEKELNITYWRRFLKMKSVRDLIGNMPPSYL